MDAEAPAGRAVTARVSVRGLSWTAGQARILDGVSLVVEAGELVALMGRNGAGKSTLIDLVAGLRAAPRGTVALDGRALESWSPAERARVLAHLPQAVRVDLPFSAEQVVLMGRYPHADGWLESDADRAAVETAMRRTGCWEFRSRALWTLSGGERQRVLLASCLAQAPRVLLLDEPSTFLDVDQQLHCFSVLQDEARRGTACLAVTHDLNLALTFCTRIVVLADRRVAFDRPTAEAAASSEWLRLFSDRLSLGRTATGRAWVSFS
jgi:ABC-type cobalamin/Fe3+-siderophores transport system ATPase subunit